MGSLSKSKIMACRQCRKRLWLEIHRPELQDYSDGAEAAFAAGRDVGEIARKLYDAKGRGTTIDIEKEGGTAPAIARTRELLASRRPIFEAGFEAKGAKVFADVLIPSREGGEPMWRMIEVKSSASVRGHHRDDVAIQAYVARKSGVRLSSVAVTHVDTGWVYPGEGRYDGLLKHEDVSEDALGRGKEVKQWIAEAHAVAALQEEPVVAMGDHCSDPFECGFQAYCDKGVPVAEHPIEWLPRRSNALKDMIAEKGIGDMRWVSDAMLSERQLRVKRCTLANETFFDQTGAAEALAPHGFPAYFLDFETISLAVPVWKGTRPYQNIAFQFSVHRLSDSGALEHEAFIDLTGGDPSEAFAKAVIEACGDGGPVYAYHAVFEAGRLDELAQRFPKLRRDLRAIIERLIDLRPIAEEHYYHPAQRGSWSLKAILPAIAPELDYASLEGVADGGMAMEAYREAVAPETTAPRRASIRSELLAYCRHDTLALVRLWQHFSGFPLPLVGRG